MGRLHGRDNARSWIVKTASQQARSKGRSGALGEVTAGPGDSASELRSVWLKPHIGREHEEEMEEKEAEAVTRGHAGAVSEWPMRSLPPELRAGFAF